jgi:dihydropyrimidinase
MRTVILGGTVVGPTGAQAAEVLVEDERVVALAEPGSEVARSFAEGAHHIDATGRLVLPGGVDVHTHMELPFGGTQASDTFETGTRAAAWGGTTTIVDFAVQRKGEALRSGLDAWQAKAEGNCAIDYGFHMIMSDVNEQSLKEMDALVGEGVTSFKLFMAYPGVFYSTDGDIFRAMQQASASGATIMMHAENGIAIDVLVSQALARGETAPKFHGFTRPDELEAEATNRAIALAKVAGSPVYIVHLSTTGALDAVAEARSHGQNAFAETCPQYLFLSSEDLARPGFEGAKYVCSPPLRAKEHQANLWRGLRTDNLSVVSTDHCPFCFKEQKELGASDFSKIPNGIPGVEHRLDLTYQGVRAGYITLSRWVEVNCTTPARLFGLYPKKGALLPGSDADIVVYNPEAKHLLSVETHHMNVDYSAYEGMEVTGEAETVLSRGQPVIEKGRYVGKKGHGRFVARSGNEYLL